MLSEMKYNSDNSRASLVYDNGKKKAWNMTINENSVI